ncbi:aminotransferase class III-fold pyridoxal phosphate-dependent enzyme [Crossiella sp. SN42]|uniref:aspartate aminotransferase family protein n=1 Tax=Crossiella sp. SN42 TaxID=2944808 RepID=UPI00207CC800|nr:aminotransferase class III-fold pyridoxal phosphate-dependent enzyme [Crossiella sp. SN42]MCO1581163.1 aminotransferase class III-fold pyridoxal phosphate-dependent enzyme [Crossiella sp. SN42]
MTVDLAAAEAEFERTATAYRTHLSRGRAALGELFGRELEQSATGAWVRTSRGRELLNCGGYGVLLMGARHPRVVAAVRAQLHTLPVSAKLLLEPVAAKAAAALTAIAPSTMDKVHFACSGAEAVETAIKLARTHGRTHLISAKNGYHGKTLGALSVTARSVFQEPFRPLLPGVCHVPYGDPDALRRELAAHEGRAALILEPVQGEAGVILPPAGYLAEAQRLCREYGAFFILDEVQTGLGRLGHWWGADRERITPDVLVAGKALGGGVLPVSAVLATESAFRAFDRDPYLHTSTFSASPLAMAAVCGAIEAIQEGGLVEAAGRLGEHIRNKLSALCQDILGSRVREVRGAGLLIGIEFSRPGMAADLLAELMAAGVIANHSLNSAQVLRLTPPATLDEAELDFLVQAFATAAKAVAG